MKIAIYSHYYKEEAKPYIEDLLKALLAKGTDIYIESNFFKLIKSDIKLAQNLSTYSDSDDIDSSFDLLFTIGGDGTLLRSITYICNSNIPVIGVNVGRLGFLATVKKEEIFEAIDALYAKDYVVKERSLLQLHTEPPLPSIEGLNFALNEITVSRKDTASMITVDTYLDEEYLTSYWADGLITSTPTGSTGYSLSCGGPVITPSAKSFVLTPVAPHNLNARPLVIPDETKIKMKISGRGNEFFISLDSRIATIDHKTEIFIQKAPFTIKMLELKNHSFIETIRKKLLWGEDTRNE